MKAVFLILNNLDIYEDVMESYYQLGLGATTIDSQGMGKTLLDHEEDFPIFSSLRKLITEDKPYNKTIISVVRDESVCETLVSQIHDLISSIPGAGFMFVLPVSNCYGSKCFKTE